MKQTHNLVTLSILAGLAATAVSARAAVIYSDQFTGTAASINGRTPDTTNVPADTWTTGARTNWGVNGSGVATLTATQPSSGGGNGAGPTISLSLAADMIYTVSFDFLGWASGDTASGHWFSLSLLQNDDGSSWFDDSIATILTEPSAGQIQTFYGSAFGNQANFSGGGIGTYSLTVNTSTGGLEFAKNGSVLRSATLSGANIAAVGAVGIGAGQGTFAGAQFDNFLVTATAVPEPTAALLGGFGLLALVRRRR